MSDHFWFVSCFILNTFTYCIFCFNLHFLTLVPFSAVCPTLLSSPLVHQLLVFFSVVFFICVSCFFFYGPLPVFCILYFVSVCLNSWFWIVPASRPVSLSPINCWTLTPRTPAAFSFEFNPLLTGIMLPLQWRFFGVKICWIIHDSTSVFVCAHNILHIITSGQAKKYPYLTTILGKQIQAKHRDNICLIGWSTIMMCCTSLSWKRL